MKKKLMLLVLLVSILALGLTFLSCELEPGLELSGTTWVFGYTKADVAAEQKITEEALDDLLTAGQITVNWPLPAMQLKFTSDKDFTLYNNAGLENYTTTWEAVGSGTYTISGDEVTLTYEGGTQIGTVDGNTLTVTMEGSTYKFNKQ